jgi:hypothetical protein
MLARTGRSSIDRAALAAALAVLVPSPAPVTAAPATQVEAAAERYGALPVRFEPNVGQFDERVEFVARAGGYTLSLTPGEAVLSLGASAPDFSQRREGAKAQRPAVVRTRLVGASVRSEGEGVGELAGVTNYFRGDDPSRWRTGVVSYGAVRYGEIYPGVDVVYYGNGGDLEYDFVVAPGADPSAIRMQIEGAERMWVDASGDLVLSVAGGELQQRAPAIYQEGPDGRERVSGGYVVRGDVVSFDVGAYDPSRALVVDPVIAYSNVLALGNGGDAFAIAVGADGSAYVVGSGGNIGVDSDAYVAKLAPSGGALVYVTYIGGSGLEFGNGIAVDANGSAYITGWTDSTNFPRVSAFQSNNGGFADAFVTRLSPSGASLVFSTYLGGGRSDGGYGIDLGGDGSVYVTGYTNSTNFPRAAPFQALLAGDYDTFVARLAPSGSALVYSTYLGGGGYDNGWAIAVGGDGSAYVTGYTASTNFPTATPLQAMFAGVLDAFVTKLSPSGASLGYSTYLGGGGLEYGFGIAVGGDDSAYVVGYTASANFPTAAPLQAALSGGDDAFVTKVAPSGSALTFSTYLGGGGDDVGYGIDVGADGSAYVTGTTFSSNFPTVAPVQASLGGPSDSFVTKLGVTGGSLVYSTYLGTDDHENYFTAIAVGADGSAYVANNLGDSENFHPAAVVTKITSETATPSGSDTVGLYGVFPNAWFLRNSNSPGPADVIVGYGGGDDHYVPVRGDWDGDGIDTIGFYDSSGGDVGSGYFFLRNSNTPGPADLVFSFGVGAAAPVVGDWDGDGVDTVGFYVPSTGFFFLRNSNTPGPADLIFSFGVGGATPIAGDWDADGVDTIGFYVSSTGSFFLRNSNTPGPAELIFSFGPGGADFVPLTGDFDGDGDDTIGVYDQSTGAFFLKNTNAAGGADLVFTYGPTPPPLLMDPFAGDWDGL